MRYIVPLVGSGSSDDPIRPMVRPVKGKEKITINRMILVDKNGKPVDVFDIVSRGLKKSDVTVKTEKVVVGERTIYYNCHIDIPNRVAIFETEEPIEDFEKLVKEGKVRKES